MRRQDEERFREFAAVQARPLRRTAYLLCGDWHLAEDLMQGALIKMYHSWSRLERRDQLNSYVRRVLLRTWLDERRKPWRRSESSCESVPDSPDVSAEPDDIAHRMDVRSLVHEALLTLPPRQRATIVLRYFDDLSVADTAAALRCSEGNVKSQTARGLRTLRQYIGDSEAELTVSITGRPAR
ncbi:RNA polymerase sigma factor [Streptomyces litchfieldiae]|uniref:SigE family RNA polymerase sigma factor n=1 Tax=Streptomyces litchfieldiae TaxID=3075543 RepID=A0ABU2MV08_9ACTN|nr:SigE family RNA polymerase sigma factor [Streptomyces sp. DSM 44938]MDT0345483.1 SigE family RNA polymerase sigma factor [Streptomyces sp. DSM 44938]